MNIDKYLTPIILMAKLTDNLTQSSALPFAQIPVKDIGLLFLSIISLQTQGDLELLYKCKAYSKKFHFV